MIISVSVEDFVIGRLAVRGFIVYAHVFACATEPMNMQNAGYFMLLFFVPFLRCASHRTYANRNDDKAGNATSSLISHHREDYDNSRLQCD